MPGPQGPPEGQFQRQLWAIPWPSRQSTVAAVVWRPAGGGPFPLAIINHASTQDPHGRVDDPTPRYEGVAHWLVRKGYVAVLPIRPGHGATGGLYLEDQGGCENADYVKAGLASAISIEATLDYMAAQPFLRKGQAVVIGQSAGGWAALALASRNPASVRAVINFSGGRGGRSLDEPNANCAADRLVAAAEVFGRTARIPTLWIYAENDSYFGPNLSKRMSYAFREAGGRVEFRLLPPFGEEGHLIMFAPEATGIWGPIVDSFLAKSR